MLSPTLKSWMCVLFCSVKLFADDVKLYVQIVNDIDVMQMQQAIDALICWATEWQLSVSVNKCCVLQNVGKITHNTCFSICRYLILLVI